MTAEGVESGPLGVIAVGGLQALPGLSQCLFDKPDESLNNWRYHSWGFLPMVVLQLSMIDDRLSYTLNSGKNSNGSGPYITPSPHN